MKHIYLLLIAVACLIQTESNAQCSATFNWQIVPNTLYVNLELDNFVGDTVATQVSWSFSCDSTATWMGSSWTADYHMGYTGIIYNACDICVHLSDSAAGCNYTYCDTVRTPGQPNTGNCSVSLTATPYSADTLYLVTVAAIGAHPMVYHWSFGNQVIDTLLDSVLFMVFDTTMGNEACLFIEDANGCIAADYMQFGAYPSGPPPCTALFVVLPDTGLLGTPGNYIGYNLSYGNYGSDILWDFGDGSTSTDPFPVHQYATPGNYVLCLTVGVAGTNCYDTYCDTSFCAHKTETNPMGQLTILSPTGIKETTKSNIRLYPNPATDQLNIKIDEAQIGAELNIYNVTGSLLQTQKLQTQNVLLNTSNFSAGVYIAEIKTKTTSVKQRWVKM